jgi:hypothetical protein
MMGSPTTGNRVIAIFKPKKSLVKKRGFLYTILVEPSGIEPLTSTLPVLRSPS